MLAHYRPPTSAVLIGKFVAALQLDSEGVLTSRTARRFFEGRWTHEKTRRYLFESVAQAVIDAGLIPPADDASLPGAKDLADVIEWHAARWDQLGAFTGRQIEPLDAPVRMDVAYLRLVVIDSALRAAGWLHLARRPVPAEDLPLWANGAPGRLLAKLRAEAYPELTLDRLAEEVGVSRNTVDSWLYGMARPRRINIEAICMALPLGKDAPTRSKLQSDLLVHYGLYTLGRMLAAHAGEDVVQDLTGACARLVARTMKFLDETKEGVPQEEQDLLGSMLLLLGSNTPGVREILQRLWQEEGNPAWKADLVGAAVDWSIRLQEVAITLSSTSDSLDTHEKARLPALSTQDFEAFKEVVLGPFLGANPGEALRRSLSHVRERTTILRHRALARPGDSRAHVELGAFLGWQGWKFRDAAALSEGIVECRIAAQLDETWDRPRVEVGIILINAGRYEDARVELETAATALATVTPHHALNLGYARMKCGDWPGALKMFDTTLQGEPDNVIALDGAAHSAFMSCKSSEGRKYMRRAVLLGHYETFDRWRKGGYRKSRPVSP